MAQKILVAEDQVHIRHLIEYKLKNSGFDVVSVEDGAAALQAALHPAQTDALYFVARGDGSSQFSSSLAAHNRAVNQYQK